MTWNFKGTGLDITSISIMRFGTLQISGGGTQECWPMNTRTIEFRPLNDDDRRLLELTQGVKAFWSIHSTDEEEVDYDRSGFGLKNYYAARRRGVGMIKYFPDLDTDPALIIATVLLPPDHMQSVFKLVKILIGRRDLHYVLGLKFDGLRVEGVNSPSPTFAEFTSKENGNRRAYFSEEVTFDLTSSP
jgi:hypothetical protein